MVGYSGQTKSLQELEAWAHWQRADPEFRRRMLAMMDASIDAGRPVGVGSVWRSTEAQRTLFLSRYKPEDDNDLTGSVFWEGKYWEKLPGVAAAAPPGRSYHESTTATGKALAADMIGDIPWMNANCQRWGLKHFANVNSEPWHIQPIETPNSRRNYVPSQHEPLPTFPISGTGVQPKPPVVVPLPTIRLATPYMNGPEVLKLQNQMKFWKWYDSALDGWFGPKSAEGVKRMQTDLKITVDGVYGPQTANAFKALLEALQNL